MIKEELLRRLVKENKWNDPAAIYHEELMKILLLRSDKFITTEDFPLMTSQEYLALKM